MSRRGCNDALFSPDRANKVIVRRGVNPTAGTAFPVLDFNAAEATSPITRRLTINNMGSDAVSLFVGFRTSRSGALFYVDPLGGSASSTRDYPAYATPQAADLHEYTLLTGVTSGANRALIAYFRDAVDRTLSLGPVIGPVTITTVATVPSVRLRAQYATQSEYNGTVSVRYDQASGAITRIYSLSASRGYLGSSTAFDTVIPDLSNLTGWNPSWGLASTAQIRWSLSRGWSQLDRPVLRGLGLDRSHTCGGHTMSLIATPDQLARHSQIDITHEAGYG